MMQFRHLLVVLFGISSLFECIQATTYYVSVSRGRDTNPGTSPAMPWRSFAPIWGKRTPFVAGDSILFCQGETWMFSNIFASAASSVYNPITWGSYKCGTSTAQPVISAAVNIPARLWTVSPVNSNILVFSLAQDDNAKASGVQALWVGDSRRYPARSPNLVNPTDAKIQFTSEFYRATSLSQSDLKVYCPSLNQPANYWAGAVAFMRINNWTYFQANIIASGNGWIQVAKNPGDVQGFFIENSGNYTRSALMAVDAPGEWVYNRDDNSIQMWPASDAERAALLSGASEANFLYGNAPPVVTISAIGHTIQDLSFRYSAGGIMQMGTSRYSTTGLSATVPSITVQRNTIKNVVGFGVFTTRADYFLFQNNVIDDADGDCLVIDSNHGVAQYNTISRCGIHAGYGFKQGGGSQGIVSINSLIQYNTVTDTGYSGIAPHYVSNVIQNTISNVMLTLNDGGAIYTFGSAGNGLQIVGNVVNNVVGNYLACNGWNISSCVFTDQGSSSIYIYNNTCSKAPQCMQLNDAVDMMIISNRCNVPGIYINNGVSGGGHAIVGNQVVTHGTSGSLQNPIARVYQPGATSLGPISSYSNNIYCQAVTNADYIYQTDFGVNGWARYYDYASWVYAECKNASRCAFEAGSAFYHNNCDSYSPYFFPHSNNAGNEGTVTFTNQQSASSVSPVVIVVPVVAGCLLVLALVAAVIFKVKSRNSSHIDHQSTLPTALSFEERSSSASLDYEQFSTPSPVICISRESGSSVELSPQYELYKSSSAPLPSHQ